MGGAVVKYFCTSAQTYAALQAAIDDAFRAEYIDTGRCDHVLPVDLRPLNDGQCYIALPEWMTSVAGAEFFVSHPSVEQISKEKYLAAAFDAGRIEGVDELSTEQLAALTPEPEGMP